MFVFLQDQTSPNPTQRCIKLAPLTQERANTNISPLNKKEKDIMGENTAKN